MIGSLAVAGCGGEEGQPSGKSSDQGSRPAKRGEGKNRRPPATAPKPRGSLEETARQFASAVGADDCDRVRSLAFSGANQLDDQRCAQLLRQLEGFEIEDSEQYRTAGVVDYRANRNRGTVVFLVGRDGRFKWASRFPRQRGKDTAGSEPPEDNRLDQTAQSAARALRRGDCEQLAEGAQGVVPQPSQTQTMCENADALRTQLAKDPEARPKQLGANSRAAFYTLLPKPNGPYVTLVLLQDGKRAALLRGYTIPAQRRK